METKVCLVDNGPGPRRRHHARVLRFSSDPDLLEHLDTLSIDDDGARVLIATACHQLGVAVPKLKFHARRSMYTGATERPRAAWVEEIGEDEVQHREANGWGALPVNGAIRLGRVTTLMTIAHELGHHLVFMCDRPGTPAHGRVWVGRFDESAGVLAGFLTN